MARTGFSSSNYLSLGTPLVTAYPFTIAGLGLINTTGIQMAFGLDSGASGTQNWWALGSNGSSHIKLETNISGTNFQAVTSTTISTGVWFHAAGVATSATSRAAFLNGSGKGTDSTSATPSGLARTVIGGAAGEQFWKSDGRLAHWALWNIALSDADVALLAKGVHPFLIHPEAILGYWPLDGYASPEIEMRKNAQAMTINGTLSRAAGPPLFYPRRLKARRFTTASGALSLTLAQASWGWTGNAAGVNARQQIAASQGAWGWAGSAPGLNAKTQIVAAQAAWAWSGQAAGLNAKTAVALAQAAWTWAGNAAGTAIGSALAMAQAAWSWAGRAASVNAKQAMTMAQASWSWAGRSFAGFQSAVTRLLHLIGVGH